MRKLLGIVLLAMMCGCGLFETRTPEEPDTGKINFEPATSPQILVNNLKKSIEQMSIDNYTSCISDGAALYAFEPSAQAKALFPAVFEEWNYSAEQRYFTSLAGVVVQGATPNLITDNISYDSGSPDSTIYSAHYTLSMPHSKTNIPTMFKGAMRLTLVQNGEGIWKILRWIDSPTATASDTVKSTWSLLKGYFY